MDRDFFAGFGVKDYAAALAWYEQLLGSPPTFIASDTEAVWEIAEHRWLYIEQRPEHAGHALFTLFVNDFDAWVARIAERRGLPCQVSLDPWMGCGLGTCLGCVVRIQGPDDPQPKYRCACTEGPVFDSRVVVWHGAASSAARCAAGPR